MMDQHTRLTCKNFEGVFWKGATVPCFVDGCEGRPGKPTSAKCADIVHFNEE